MATAMRTFGNTLSELQAGTNADKAIDYQRANAQDAINAQRLESFLKLAGQQFEAKARQNEAAAARAQRMSEFLQQNKQFETSEANRLKLGEMDARSRLDVAKATAEGRVDPRMFESFAEIQALNNENLNKIRYAEQLSQARRAALAAKNRKMDPSEDTFGWRNAPYAKRVSEADALLKQLDTQAATLGLAPSPDGGYVVPTYNPIPLPNIGRAITPEPAREPVITPPQTQPQVPAAFQGGYDVVPGSVFDRLLNPVPSATPMFQIPPSPTRRTLRWDAMSNDFMP